MKIWSVREALQEKPQWFLQATILLLGMKDFKMTDFIMALSLKQI